MEDIFQRADIEQLSDSISSESLGSSSDTPRTGVSTYDGLANSTRPTPIARNQSFIVTSSPLSRAESGCSADANAPEYAPPTGFERRAESVATRLVTRSVGELKPHPSYVRHNLSTPPFKLAALEEQGEAAFSHPILIAQDNCIIDGYARWELAKRKGRPTLICLEYCLTSEDALEELVRKHRRSQGMNDFVRIVLALDLELYLKDRAFLNRQAGGRLKGLSKLTTAEKVNSRVEVARVAQVSVGNVHKVKYVLLHACSQLKEAAMTGEVSINLAEKWSHEADAKQRECLRTLRIERGIRRKAKHLVAAEIAQLALSNRNEQVTKLSDLAALLSRLTTSTPEHSKEFDSIEINILDGPGRAIFITAELIRALTPSREVSVR